MREDEELELKKWKSLEQPSPGGLYACSSDQGKSQVHVDIPVLRCLEQLGGVGWRRGKWFGEILSSGF